MAPKIARATFAILPPGSFDGGTGWEGGRGQGILSRPAQRWSISPKECTKVLRDAVGKAKGLEATGHLKRGPPGSARESRKL